LSLLARVCVLLESHGTHHAVIGAAALAAHGVPRATADLDLLVVDARCLDDSIWGELRESGIGVEVRRGDATDPLAGVIRLTAEGEPGVDLIVGRDGWQRDLLRRAKPARIEDASVPLVEAADLVLLKLFAGGPQDAWDVDQLLEVDGAIAPQVEARLADLPRECAELWASIRRQRRSSGL
jgi:hypothetical protein